MNKDFSDFISAVLDKTNIVSLISRYAHLERKGNTHWACCPFHHETQPSFSVSEEKQVFHCFGCKESGNAISFLMKIENIEFIDALKLLAEQAGMEMPAPSGSFGQKTDKKHRELLYNLMRDAARHYNENLSDPRAKVFTSYLAERKIPQNMITRFGLGASLDFNEMIDYLKAKGYTYDQMHDAGLAETKDGRQYDVFGKRLIFPIIDNMGHVVAFGGRTLEKDVHFAKYRNSTQTEIFDKSKVIYGINLLKKVKAKRAIDSVIMTEGYMDVISLHKAGFDTAVASMGTALTQRQAKQLKLYADKVYICYDGDSAGQKATMRGLDILRETGITVKVVRLPDGLDPDDLIKRDGPEGYQKCLDEAVPLTAYKIDVLGDKCDMSDPDQKAAFAIEATRFVATLDNPIEQEQYLEYISKRTGFSTEALRMQADIVVPPPSKKKEEMPSDTTYDDALMFFLSSILQAHDYVDYDKDVIDALPDERCKRLYTLCRSNRVKNTPALVYGSDMFDDSDKPFLDALLDYKALPGDGRAKFVDIEYSLYRKVLENECENLNKLYSSSKDQSYLIKLRDIHTELNKIRTNRP